MRMESVEPPSTEAALLLMLAHAVGSPEFYWAVVAELSLLAFTVLLLLAPRWGWGSDVPFFRLVVFGAALLASLVTLIGKLLEVWPGNPLFPSGHTAYALTVAAFLVARDRRWLLVVGPLAGLLALALVLALYHPPVDIAGGAAVALVIFAMVSGGWRAWTARRLRASLRT